MIFPVYNYCLRNAASSPTQSVKCPGPWEHSEFGKGCRGNGSVPYLPWAVRTQKGICVCTTSKRARISLITHLEAFVYIDDY